MKGFLINNVDVQASFGNRKKTGSSTDFNPYFGTDYGICSIIKPQTAFKPELGRTGAALLLYTIIHLTLIPDVCIYFLYMLGRLHFSFSKVAEAQNILFYDSNLLYISRRKI